MFSALGLPASVCIAVQPGRQLLRYPWGWTWALVLGGLMCFVGEMSAQVPADTLIHLAPYGSVGAAADSLGWGRAGLQRPSLSITPLRLASKVTKLPLHRRALDWLTALLRTEGQKAQKTLLGKSGLDVSVSAAQKLKQDIRQAKYQRLEAKNQQYQHHKHVADPQGPDALTLRRDSSLDMIVVTRQDFALQGYATVGEVLRTLPGVYFEDPSANDRPSLRGLGAAYTQVLVDGKRLPGADEDRTLTVDNLPASLVERIEIIRSGAPELDAQGIGGTINIVLKPIPPKPHLDASLSLGHNPANGWVGNANAQYGRAPKGKSDGLGYLIGGAMTRRINGVNNDKRDFGQFRLDKLRIQNQYTAFNEINFAPRFSLQTPEGHQFTLSPLVLISDGYQYRFNRDLDYRLDSIEGQAVITAIDRIRERTEDRLRRTLGMRLDYAHEPIKNLRLSGSFNLARHFQRTESHTLTYDLEGQLVNDSYEQRKTWDHEIIMDFRADYRYHPNLSASAGLGQTMKWRTIDREKRNNDLLERTKTEDLYRLNENRTFLYAWNDARFGPGQLKIGGRWEFNRIVNRTETVLYRNFYRVPTTIEKHGLDATFTPVFQYSLGIDPRKITDLGAELLPFLRTLLRTPLVAAQDSLIQKIKDLTRWESSRIVLKPGLTRNVRRPSFNDLNPFVEERMGTLLQPDKGGNPDLNPETSYTLTLSGDYFFPQKKGVLGLHVYHCWLRDMIAKDVRFDTETNRYVERPFNPGDGRAWGFGLDFGYEFKHTVWGQFRPKLNASWAATQILDPKNGKPRKLSDQPRTLLNAGLDYNLRRWRNFVAGVQWNHYPGQQVFVRKLNGDSELQTLTSLNKLDAYAGLSITPELSVRLSGQNLLHNFRRKEKQKWIQDEWVSGNIDMTCFLPTYLVTFSYQF